MFRRVNKWDSSKYDAVKALRGLKVSTNNDAHISNAGFILGVRYSRNSPHCVEDCVEEK